ncbi:hypothetical protein H6F86_01160 [Phormidium sp. FACHB-592]|uniref:Uncharacterized protein n=1 Tax=Stenomitos frigidus AS-A4 TaxID=2933935 RepID=A0ABV0KR52_9CYAN|nr:hypothetical protein [Phormidium sp. FACHB-592]MBD2072544.1 hypothetical protein [Phormidium sp. FACHB-592]
MGTLEQTETEPTRSEPAGAFLPETPSVNPLDQYASLWHLLAAPGVACKP